MGLNFFCPLWKVQACVLKRMIEAQRCKATAFFHSVSVDIWFSEQLRWICIVLFCEMIEDMDSWAKYSILCSIRSNTAKNVQSKCRDDAQTVKAVCRVSARVWIEMYCVCYFKRDTSWLWGSLYGSLTSWGVCAQTWESIICQPTIWALLLYHTNNNNHHCQTTSNIIGSALFCFRKKKKVFVGNLFSFDNGVDNGHDLYLSLGAAFWKLTDSRVTPAASRRQRKREAKCEALACSLSPEGRPQSGEKKRRSAPPRDTPALRRMLPPMVYANCEWRIPGVLFHSLHGRPVLACDKSASEWKSSQQLFSS